MDVVVLLVETGADDKSKDIEVTMTLFQKIEKELEGERKTSTSVQQNGHAGAQGQGGSV